MLHVQVASLFHVRGLINFPSCVFLGAAGARKSGARARPSGARQNARQRDAAALAARRRVALDTSGSAG